MTGVLLALFILGVALSAADGVLTVMVLRAGGKEWNPLYVWAFRVTRTPAMVLLVSKIVAASVAYRLALELLTRGERDIAFGVLLAGVALFGSLCALNWRNLRRLQGR